MHTMKFSPRKILAFAFLLALPLALFLVLRAQASWRPQRVPGATYHGLIAFSPDGTRFANASRGGHGSITLYDVALSREIARHDFHGFGDNTYPMSFSPDGKTLAVSWRNNGGDNGFGLWNFEKEKWEFKRNGVYASYRLQFSTNGKMVWIISNNVQSCDLSSGRVKWLLFKNRDTESFEVLSRDGRFCFGFDKKGQWGEDDSGEDYYCVWDVVQKRQILRTKIPSGHSVEPFDGDMTRFFSPDASLFTYHGDVANNSFRFVGETHTGRILWRAPDDSGTRFVGDKVALRKAGKFEICDARTGKIVRRLNALPNTMPIASPSNDWLYSVDENGGLFRQRLR